MARAVVGGSAGWLALFLLTLAATAVFVRNAPDRTRVTTIGVLLVPPPPLIQDFFEPKVPVPPTAITQPKSGIVAPVQDEQVQKVEPFASQQDLSKLNAGDKPGDTPIVLPVAPPEVAPRWGEIVNVEVYPEVIKSIKPDYPALAHEAQVEGTLYVHVLVGKDGHVADAFVEQKSSIPLLDGAALEAAKKWVFSPALNNNHPVMVWVTIPMRFSLQ
jgi:protein TonB